MTVSPADLLFTIISAILVLLLYCFYFCAVRPERGTTEWIHDAVRRSSFRGSLRRHPLEARDLLVILPVCVLYAAVSLLMVLRTGIGTSGGIFYSLYSGSALTLWTSVASLGSSVFSPFPYAQQFTGIFFGLLTLAVFGFFMKSLTGRRDAVLCGMLLLLFSIFYPTACAAEPRAACSAFFAVLSFYMMYIWATSPEGASFFGAGWPMLVCGAAFGAGCAVSLATLFSAPGLFLMFVFAVAVRGGVRPFTGWRTVISVLLFFVIVPAAVFVLSLLCCRGYFVALYGHAQRPLSLLLRFGLIDLTDGTKYAFSFGSAWGLLFLPARTAGIFSCAAAGGVCANPLVWWGTLPAMIVMAVRAFGRRDAGAFLLLLAWLPTALVCYLSGVAAAVTAFIPALVLSAAGQTRVLAALFERSRSGGRAAAVCFTVCAGIVFALAFIILCGLFK